MTDDADDSAQQRNQARTRLWDFVVVLDQLLAHTGPEHQPPRFAEAVDAGEEWTDGEVKLVWDALLRALKSWVDPMELKLRVGWQAGTDAETPLKLSLTILRELRLRWRVDFVTNMKHELYVITRGSCVIVDPDVDPGEVPWTENAEVPWTEAFLARREIARREIPAPIMEPAKHVDLAWCHDRLLRMHHWLDWIDRGAPGGERPAPPGIEGPPLRVVGGEDETDPEPAVELGERALADDLRKRKRSRPTQANLIEFMVGRKSATYDEASDPIYGEPDADHDKFRKTVGRVNRFMELRKSKIRYELGDGRIFKNLATD